MESLVQACEGFQILVSLSIKAFTPAHYSIGAPALENQKGLKSEHWETMTPDLLIDLGRGLNHNRDQPRSWRRAASALKSLLL